ncbi:MAG: 3-deoxy-D-manno-octulosonic acid transferase, partial [Longimicrobiales bacterium]
LYSVGDVAYVGGGFGRRGLHSVIEPAAAGVPVLFGPHHGRSAAAGALLSVGGALAVADPRELAEAAKRWLLGGALREQASEHAFVYIQGHRGAARRTADLLDPLLPPRPPV